MGHSKHTSLRPDELNSESADGANVYGPRIAISAMCLIFTEPARPHRR